MNSTIENSSVLVCSYYRNVMDILKGRTVKDPFKTIPVYVFTKMPAFTIKNCQRIYNDIENHYYTYTDIFLFVAYRDLLGKKCYIQDITRDDVKSVSKLFTILRVKDDLLKLKSIAKKSGITKMSEFFELDDNGDNILRNLVLGGHISPLTYIKKIRNSLTSPKEFNRLCSVEVKSFHKKLQRIKIRVLSIKQRSA